MVYFFYTHILYFKIMHMSYFEFSLMLKLLIFLLYFLKAQNSLNCIFHLGCS